MNPDAKVEVDQPCQKPGVEVAGIEPASFNVSVSLLRAQSLGDCQALEGSDTLAVALAVCECPRHPRRHGWRASPADDGTDARRTGAVGPNSHPEVRLRAPDRRVRRWRLYFFPAL